MCRGVRGGVHAKLRDKEASQSITKEMDFGIIAGLAFHLHSVTVVPLMLLSCLIFKAKITVPVFQSLLLVLLLLGLNKINEDNTKPSLGTKQVMNKYWLYFPSFPFMVYASITNLTIDLKL